MGTGELKTDLFPDRLRAGRKDGEHKQYGQNGKGGIYKNVIISVETAGERGTGSKDKNKNADTAH